MPPGTASPPDPAPVVPPETLQAALKKWRRQELQHWLPVVGDSMRPLLLPGDEVLVAHGPAAPQPGQIAAFNREGGVYVHRVLAGRWQGQALLLLQGDANPRPDPPVKPEDLLGLAVVRRREGAQLDLLGLGPRLAGGWVARLHHLAHLAAPRGAAAHLPRRAMRMACRWLAGAVRALAWGR
jgi:hypothetical protein